MKKNTQNSRVGDGNKLLKLVFKILKSKLRGEYKVDIKINQNS